MREMKDGKTIRLKYVVEILGRIGFRGYTEQDLVDENEGAITLSPSNIQNMKMDYSKCSFLTWQKYYESPEIKIKDRDVLFVKTGSTYGKAGYVENLPMEATINPQLVVFKNIKMNSKLLFYMLQMPLVKDQCELAVVGGTIPTMSQVKIGNIYIPSLPLNEQQRIADFLDRECGKIDGLKADIQAQIDTLEQYKRSVITEAVTHGLNPSAPMKDSGINYISEHPIHWSLRRLKYILNERNERSVTGTEELLSVSLYKGVIPSTEMTNRTMQADSLIGYKRVHKGDLVFNKLNPGMARFGCSDYDGITSPDFAVYIVNENYCNAKFLQYLLKTDFYVEKIKSVSMGVGDGFTRLYSNQLYEFFVALPPRDEVSIIINYLDNKCAEIERIIADKKSQIETLDGYKKSLIYEYVTGKKEVV